MYSENTSIFLTGYEHDSVRIYTSSANISIFVTNESANQAEDLLTQLTLTYSYNEKENYPSSLKIYAPMPTPNSLTEKLHDYLQKNQESQFLGSEIQYFDSHFWCFNESQWIYSWNCNYDGNWGETNSEHKLMLTRIKKFRFDFAFIEIFLWNSVKWNLITGCYRFFGIFRGDNFDGNGLFFAG